MKIRGIKRFERLENVHEKYSVYYDINKCIMVENLSEKNRGGLYYYAPDGHLTEIFGYSKRDSWEKLMIDYVSFDSLVPGDFFISGDDVYCAVRWKGKIAAQVCKYDEKVRRFKADAVVARIEVASSLPDSFFDKAYNLVTKIFS